MPERIPPIVLDMFSHIFQYSNCRGWKLSERNTLHKIYFSNYKRKHIAKRIPAILQDDCKNELRTESHP